MKQFLPRPKPDAALIAAKAAKLRELTAHYLIDETQLEAWIMNKRILRDFPETAVLPADFVNDVG